MWLCTGANFDPQGLSCRPVSLAAIKIWDPSGRKVVYQHTVLFLAILYRDGPEPSISVQDVKSSLEFPGLWFTLLYKERPSTHTGFYTTLNRLASVKLQKFYTRLRGELCSESSCKNQMHRIWCGEREAGVQI